MPASETRPLWGAQDQATRLVELTSDEPHVKEAPLRRDVRSLGRLLGEVLQEQAGETFFNAVEEIRQLAIEYRESVLERQQDQNNARAHNVMERIALIVGDMGMVDAYRMTKAFAVEPRCTGCCTSPPGVPQSRRRSVIASSQPVRCGPATGSSSGHCVAQRFCSRRSCTHRCPRPAHPPVRSPR